MVKQIEIGGELRPVHFSINALIEFEELTGTDMLNGGTMVDFRSLKKLRALTYVGLKYGARNEGKEFKHTQDEVGDWLNLADGSINKITDAFRTANQPQESATESTAAEKN
jgi:hypothetical protein